MDLVYIAMVIGFFALTRGLVTLCGVLGGAE
jgi:hypothetical protein